MTKHQNDKTAKKSSFDVLLFITVIILTVFGLVMIFSASIPSARAYQKDSLSFVKSQIPAIAVGLVMMLVCASIDYKVYKKFAVWIFALNIVLLLSVALFGSTINGAKRWISLPIPGFSSFQPSEVTKVSVVLLMASVLSNIDPKKQTLAKIYIPVAVFVGIPALFLILQPHFSVIIIIGMTVGAMLLCYGLKLKYYMPAAIAAVMAAIVLVIKSPYRFQRLLAYRNPFLDKQGDGWQIVQSLYAIGSGGLFGLGLTRGRQKHMYLPEPQNDYIFSVICEELGLIGGLVVIALFVFLFIRCMKVALECPDPLGLYMAFGLGMLIIIQVVMNIAVATNVIPSTGIMLPFFSAGGTGIVINMAAMGIVLNISRHRS